MTYTYPAPLATVANGDTVAVHHLLNSPKVVAKRVQELAMARYIADFLLTGRFKAEGGVILYENGEPIGTNADPEAIAPGAGYPQTTIGDSQLFAARTTKWGQDVPVTDEAISRLNINPVNKAFSKLVNQSIKFVDGASLGVIASRVTQSYNVAGAGAPGAWTDGNKLVEGVMLAKAQVAKLELGYDPNVIVLNDDQWAKAVSRLQAAGLLPRESSNPLVTGTWPQTLGLTWVATSHAPFTDPFLVDNANLGGMADEEIGGPGYAKAPNGVGVETKVIRQDENDKYLLRARRVTVPVVTDPLAAIRITGTGV